MCFFTTTYRQRFRVRPWLRPPALQVAIVIKGSVFELTLGPRGALEELDSRTSSLCSLYRDMVCWSKRAVGDKQIAGPAVLALADECTSAGMPCRRSYDSAREPAYELGQAVEVGKTSTRRDRPDLIVIHVICRVRASARQGRNIIGSIWPLHKAMPEKRLYLSTDLGNVRWLQRSKLGIDNEAKSRFNPCRIEESLRDLLQGTTTYTGRSYDLQLSFPSNVATCGPLNDVTSWASTATSDKRPRQQSRPLLSQKTRQTGPKHDTCGTDTSKAAPIALLLSFGPKSGPPGGGGGGRVPSESRR
jgi:hypothetical protein